MSVPHATALTLVMTERSEAVLNAVAADSYATSTLKASLGVLRNVIAEIQAGDSWCRCLVIEQTPTTVGWPTALHGVSPASADDVEHQLAEANRLASSEPFNARNHLLRAAERLVTEAWHSEELRPLLTEARRFAAGCLDAQSSLVWTKHKGER